MRTGCCLKKWWRLEENWGRLGDPPALTCVPYTCSWSMQFFGHFVFEGRSPALFDNLFQSLYCAPFFVLFEVMFMFGYRPGALKAGA